MGILSWLTRRRRELELDEEDFQAEVRAHLAIAAEEKVADGVGHQDARYAALREFGNVTQTTEAARRVWTPRWLGGLRDLSSDIRYTMSGCTLFSAKIGVDDEVGRASCRERV